MVFLCQDQFKGLLLTVLASMLQSFAAMLVSWLDEFQGLSKASWRFAITFIIADFIVVFYFCKDTDLTGTFWPPSKNREFRVRMILLIIRSIVGSAAVILQVCSLTFLSLGDSTVIAYSCPVFVSFLAFFLLKEPLGYFSFFIALFTFSGVIVITKPPFLTGEYVWNVNLVIGVSLAFGSMLFKSLSMVLLRFLKTVHHASILSTYAICGAVQSISLAFAVDGNLALPSDTVDVIKGVTMGLLACLGQVCLIKGTQIENAGLVALIRTGDVVFAFLWQIIFLRDQEEKQHFTWMSYVGALIVLTGILLASLQKFIGRLDDKHVWRKRLNFILL